MELFSYILVGSIVVIAIAFISYIKSGKKMRRFILVFNGIIYLGFIILFVLNFITNLQSDKLSDKYDRYSGTILSGWTYHKTENGYHYISSSYMFGSDDYLIPEETCEVSPMTKITHAATVYAIKGNQIELKRNIEMNGHWYIYAPQIVRVEPEYFNWTFSYMILGGGILIVGNLVVLVIVVVNMMKKRRQNG